MNEKNKKKITQNFSTQAGRRTEPTFEMKSLALHTRNSLLVLFGSGCVFFLVLIVGEKTKDLCIKIFDLNILLSNII
jgi:hypothetical protein